MGVYCIHAARCLFREEPTAILASTASKGEARFRKTEEMTSALMRFPGERRATFTCSIGAAPVGQYALDGTKGTLVADPAYEYAEGLTHRVTINEKTRTRRFPKRDQVAAELVYFSNCILKNTSRSLRAMRVWRM